MSDYATFKNRVRSDLQRDLEFELATLSPVAGQPDERAEALFDKLGDPDRAAILAAYTMLDQYSALHDGIVSDAGAVTSSDAGSCARLRDIGLRLDVLRDLRAQAWSARNSENCATPGSKIAQVTYAKVFLHPLPAPARLSCRRPLALGVGYLPGVAPGDYVYRDLNPADPVYKGVIFLCGGCARDQRDFWDDRMKLYSMRGRRAYLKAPNTAPGASQ
jgi:hypothetical protein